MYETESLTKLYVLSHSNSSVYENVSNDALRQIFKRLFRST